MVLAKKETQIARQRIHQRTEGRPERKPSSWAVESHSDIHDLVAWSDGARKTWYISGDGLTGAGQNTVRTMKEAYLCGNLLQGRHGP